MQNHRFTLPTPARPIPARRTIRALGAGAAALGVVTLTGTPAGAHVSVTPSTTAAGSYAVLTFSVGHGCEGSPTTRLTIAMPEDIPAVTPTVHPGWRVEKVAETLDEPIADAHGNEITERIAQVVYTARTPLPEGYRDTVELQVQLPDAEGETLTFPVVQTCAQGETAWNETAAEGQDPEELESPAPMFTITPAGEEGEHAETTGDTGGTDDTGDAGTGLALVGLLAGVGGLALGGLALARSGKRA